MHAPQPWPQPSNKKNLMVVRPCCSDNPAEARYCRHCGKRIVGTALTEYSIASIPCNPDAVAATFSLWRLLVLVFLAGCAFIIYLAR
jgi:hypothetical protein